MSKQSTVIPNQENLQIDYKQIVESTNYIFVVLNGSGKVVKINQKCADVLGCPAEKIIGQDWFKNFLPAKDKKPIRQIFERLKNGEQKPVEFYENSVVDCQGRERLISWHNIIQRDSAGHFLYSISRGLDITEERAEHNKLIASEQQYHLLSDTIIDAIVTTDLSLIIKFVNPAVTRLLGFLSVEMIGKSFTKFLTAPSIILTDKTLAQELLLEKQPGNDPDRPSMINLDFKHRDGRIISTEINPVFIRDENKKPIGILGVIRDISARQEAETLNNQIIEISPLGIFILNKAGVIEYANRAMIEISATPKEKMLGFNLIDSPTYKKIGLDVLIKQAIAEKKPFKTEVIKYVSLFGQKESYRVFSGMPMLDADGNFNKLLLTIDDQTEITRKNEELKSMNQLMTGREIKMVELKTEIDRLKKALDKKTI